MMRLSFLIRMLPIGLLPLAAGLSPGGVPAGPGPLGAAAARQAGAPYRNPNLPIEQRAEDLLRRMTLEEKVAQMLCLWQQKPQERDSPDFSADRGALSREKARQVMPHGIGQIARQRERKGPRESAMFANDVQRFLIDETRLGIPAIFHDEGLHGHMALGGAHFPTPLGLASTWDVELVGRIFTAVAAEVRSRGGHLVLGPNLDLARDPRWGRTEETYGEDPYLVSRMAVAAIRGLQGPGPQIGDRHVLATAKHFAAHGQPEGGTNIGPANFSPRMLHEIFLPPFEAAVREARVAAVMASYNEIDGIPAHADRWLLDHLLRRDWRFDGFVVADYYGISQLRDIHRVAETLEDAARQALAAGVDIELPDPIAYPTLIPQVQDGRIHEGLIDRAVRRLLVAKFRLGLFEHPYVDPETAARTANSPAHRELALEAARRSIVLLKNDDGLLPLDRGRIKTLAVIGPNAADVHLGGYSDDPGRGVSVLDGIRAVAGQGVRVLYTEGVKITRQGGNWWADQADLTDPAEDAAGIEQAVSVARPADAAVLVIGGNEDTNKEGWAENHLGDRDSLDLVGRQEELVRAVVATGTPTIVFLVNSGPLSIPYVAEHVPAVLEGWYLGQEGGTAAAEVLFGDHNPGGRLPVSFPRSVGQLPIAYNHKPSARRGYLFTDKAPLFAFGHGLSYTRFEYGAPTISPAEIAPDGDATVTVTVRNTGNRSGREVVQLYIRDQYSSVTRPMKELKGFAAIDLKPGESRQVTFRLGPRELAFFDRQMRRVVEPGTFDVMVGPHTTTLVVRDTP